MGIAAGLLQIIGFICLFTPLLPLGIFLIVFGGVLYFFSDKSEEKKLAELDKVAQATKKADEWAKEADKLSFQKSYQSNPFSRETEEIFNKSSKWNVWFGNGIFDPRLMEQLRRHHGEVRYKELIAAAVLEFESAYKDRGNAYIERNKTEDTRLWKLLGENSGYLAACKLLQKRPIFELAEEIKRLSYESDSYKKAKDRLVNERIEYIRNLIVQQSANQDYSQLRRNVEIEFRSKFNTSSIEVWRTDGMWRARIDGVLYNL